MDNKLREVILSSPFVDLQYVFILIRAENFLSANSVGIIVINLASLNFFQS